ncbi:hypothetical protein SEMRO_1113_G242670.1 [Seminavis robusta]|uniref:Uncharacterized protein n=1 Tax=Seminavis robusta TaxID=568900 RepID=A0A9N8EI23_9STRA|nr:hypothetical protein SEMRO_1113_G242670.1 [Seminavis robusta]|eukprot:Sro1113_g242670.1 n/a (174) ;mRNA; f:20898-21419
MAANQQLRWTTFEVTTNRPVVVDEYNLRSLGDKINQTLERAVNEGTNLLLAVLVHPDCLLPSNRTFFDNVNGTVRSSSMQHMEIISNQGNRKVLVQIVGGASPFGLAVPIPDGNDDNQGNGGDGDDNQGDDGNKSDDAEEDAEEEGSSTEGESSADDDSSEGETFVGLSQLTI